MKIFGDKKTEVEITIANRTIIRVLAMVIGSFILFSAIIHASHAITLIFIAFFLALALNAPVHWVSSHLPGKRRGNRTLATATAFILVVLAIGTFLALITPPLARQTGNFIDSVPGFVEDVRDGSSSLGAFIQRNNLDKYVDQLSEQFSEWGDNFTGNAVDTAGRVGGSVVSVLTVLVLTFMMLIEGPKWVELGKKLTPDNRKKHVEGLTHDMYRVIKGYVNGQVLLAALASLFILPVLLIMDVSYPFALVVVVFICGLIPMVGHTIGAILVSLVALITSPLSALVVFGFYILYQQIENYAVQPKIQANSTDMSPLLVFGSVVIGVSFGGILGGLVAIPVAGCLRILVLDYLTRRKIIEDKGAVEV